MVISLEEALKFCLIVWIVLGLLLSTPKSFKSYKKRCQECKKWATQNLKFCLELDLEQKFEEVIAKDTNTELTKNIINVRKQRLQEITNNWRKFFRLEENDVSNSDIVRYTEKEIMKDKKYSLKTKKEMINLLYKYYLN